MPAKWRTLSTMDGIWITSYRIMFADKESLQEAQIYDLDKLRVIISFGRLGYLKVRDDGPTFDGHGTPQLNVRADSVESPESGWLIILQPCSTQTINTDEHKLRRRAGTYRALFSALNGRNMAFYKLFENLLRPADNVLSASSNLFVNPKAFPRPDLSKEKCAAIYRLALSIQSAPDKTRRRSELSLHWFERGMQTSGLDSFINYWIAIETLGMAETTNVRPLHALLAKGYGMSIQEAIDTFCVGKLFGLRSRILHDGENIPINTLLLEYMESLFVDVLLQTLGAKPEHRTLTTMNKAGFDLDALLHIQKGQKGA